MSEADIGRMDTQTGGKLYDEGGYGCIFKPPLKCKGEVQQAQKNETPAGHVAKLDKLLRKRDADAEFKIAVDVQKIPLWKNYFLVAEAMCTPAPLVIQTDRDIAACDIVKSVPLEKTRLLRLRYGGVPLTVYKMNITKFPFYDFVKHMLEGAALLTLFGIVHKDLHMGNILVDDENVPRLIDFNLSINVQDKSISDAELFRKLNHVFEPSIYQDPPDSALLAAINNGLDPYTAIGAIMEKNTFLKKIRALLNVSERQQLKSLTAFYEKSRSMQNGDYVTWFRTYWRTIDSWGIGCNIVFLILRQSLWPSFMKGDYAKYEDKLTNILVKMCDVNPTTRIDCVQALAMLEPNSYIIKRYASAWLSKVGLPS